MDLQFLRKFIGENKFVDALVWIMNKDGIWLNGLSCKFMDEAFQ